ncbi:30S ribosomal protein S8 [Candidatus Purcelliella pentastirinorum]|uniref:Small ribosomal subunit protein uS8 n=1 Tax=Candidatus Purcelliella pentastirinorum TaxID=472834 RepID=A0AAX3N806_9ENTR|nr:30S ribosomal protein S8 [Candidatus Purcelliella pentastirinorum]WDI78574.1 30S ribosomal protein S8 [Candidatus Purcelliella pentastirinorum]WDR80398.1 30S ribosomal protein S8 [Candidatus Purcelliella pentastirinorum]
MSLHDPISDMLVSISNGQKSNKILIFVPNSNIKRNILLVLKNEGYIIDFELNGYFIKIFLKYFNDKSVIEYIKRVSSPGLRVYKPTNQLPNVLSGFGIAIISTSQGVMTDKDARKKGIGGEIICYVA